MTTIDPVDPFEDDEPEEDPGDVLREYIENLEIPEINEIALADLLYTADERCVLDYRVDVEDALLIYKICEIARKARKSEIERMRM